MENNSDFIQILLEKIEKDDLPTNVFDVEGTDPLVLLGKMNEIIGQLENFQSTVNTSNTTANEALSKANEAKLTAENALEQVTQGLGTKVYDNAGNLLNETTFTGENGVNVDMDSTTHKNFVVSINQTITNQIEQNKNNIAQLNNDVSELNQTANSALTTANSALTTANGAVSKNTQQDASISALQTADGQNVKLTGDQRITGVKTFENSIILYFNDNISSQISITANGELTLNKLYAKGTSYFEYIPHVIGRGPIVDSHHTSTSSWVRFADGTQICLGFYSGSTGDKTVTLPSPFANTNYVVVWGSESDDNRNVTTRMISARNRTTSTFVNRFVTSNPMMYIAIGKWK